MRFWLSPTAFVGGAPVAVLSWQKHRFHSFLSFTVTPPFETTGACRRLDENRPFGLMKYQKIEACVQCLGLQSKEIIDSRTR
ncbi:hypothetical protein [Agrobacterium pusense]|uniref:hypothetical protein n=1 Tax=Agrobacterium pusense TaxID=648995 RepID=UPI001C6EA6CC|nr:hypothetical protein [Agrobacterium pusense]MBW9070000.1 hypothetical protein [Agrobacterium pusense]MBW9084761.1 hypothetical protein [Agrobacterium pusense]MBW9125365.1 hypothetical protein [Agrobacterium pusense]MBW9137780.1 hypothetical protein [Agrobacterium pusense]